MFDRPLLPQLFQEAQAAFQQQQWQHCLKLSLQLVQQQPSFWPVYPLQVSCLFHLGQYTQARQLAERICHSFPQQPETWQIRAHLYQQLGEFRQAVALYQQLLQDWPEAGNRVWLCLTLAELALELGELPLAACVLTGLAALQLSADENRKRWHYQAALAFAEGNFDALRQALQQAQALLSQQHYYLAHETILHGVLALGREAARMAAALYGHQPAYDLQAASLGLQEQLYQQLGAYMLQVGEQRLRPAEQIWLESRVSRNQQPTRAQQLAAQAIQLAPERLFWRLQYLLGSSEQQALNTPEQQQLYLESAIQQLMAVPAGSQQVETLQPEWQFLPEVLWDLMYFSRHLQPLGQQPPELVLKQAYLRCFSTQPLELPPRHASKQTLRLGVVVTTGHEGIFTLMAAPTFRELQQQFGHSFEITLIGNLGLLPLLKGVQRLELNENLTLAAQQIAAQGFDLLYYWEAGSDVYNQFLPLFRLAPVQVASWGLPMSTGLTEVDYFLSSRLLEPPEAQLHYSETLICLPTLPSCGDDPLPFAGKLTRHELGLPAEQVIYLCLQTTLKLSEELIACFAEILSQSENSCVYLSESRFPWVTQRVQAWTRAYEKNLPPLNTPAAGGSRSRFVWLPASMSRPHYLNWLALADLILDPFDCSGGQSSFEALAMGTPLLSWPGGSLRQRISLGYLQLLGCEQLIAHDRQDYQQKALNLVKSPLREQLRAQIASQRAALFQAPQCAQALAACFQNLCDQQGVRND